MIICMYIYISPFHCTAPSNNSFMINQHVPHQNARIGIGHKSPIFRQTQIPFYC